MNEDKLVRLLPHVDADITVPDVLDLLWLAPLISPGQPVTTPDHPGSDAASADPGPTPGQALGPRADESSGPAGRKASFYHSHDQGNAYQAPGMPASAIGAPEARSLTDTLELSRSLRLLKRHKRSEHETQIDEVASAENVAETRIWVPAMRPRLRRWIDLALVIDAHESMDLWRSLALEFRAVLEDLGAFRDIRMWSIDWAQGASGLPEIRSSASGSSARSPKELVSPSGNRAIVIFSDCVCPGWQSEAARAVLTRWAEAGPVAILQPLPQRLWEHTRVDPVQVQFTASEAGAPNKKLRYRELYEPDPAPQAASGAGRPDDAARPIPIPIVELSPAAASDWSRLVTGSGSDLINGSVMLLTPPDEQSSAHRAGPRRAYRPDELVRRFQLVASPSAMRLAECLSAAPVSIPIMRLIQNAVLKRPDQTAIAEVFLGGLLRRVPAAAGSDVRQYDFAPGVREQLLSRLKYGPALDVLTAVSDEIGKHLGRTRAFRALIAGEGIDGDIVLDPASRPFAMVAASVLGRLGGQFAATGLRLQAMLGPPARPGPLGDVEIPGDVAAEAPESATTRHPQEESHRADGLKAFTEALKYVSLPPPRSNDRPLVCPYCYYAFAKRSIMFRCSGNAEPDRVACVRHTDPVLQKEMNVSTQVLPAFASSSRRDTARCPQCRGETSEQICPNCHSSLPPMFRSFNSRLVALIGSSEAGKTAFMTVLIHELGDSIGKRLNSSTMAADNTTLERFAQSYESPLYDDGDLFPRTTTPEQEYIRPLVFRFTLPAHGRLRERKQELLLSFADSAGEDLVSRDKVNLMARYLAAADAVVVTIDPLQFEDVRRRITVEAALPTKEDPATSLERITRLLAAGSKADIIDKPTAVVVTKLDAIWECLPENSVLRGLPSTPSQFDPVDSGQVQDEVERFLRASGADAINKTLRRRYSNWRYFAVSALGSPPTRNNSLSSKSIIPHRIDDPMMWILDIFGMTQRASR